jgi:transaldolase/glucose-6-phosphate isomerase
VTTERRELVARIWSRDPTVWTGSDEARWLGWLDEPVRMREHATRLLDAAAKLIDEIDAVVLLGMGGSSLAPEVLRRSFGGSSFHVLDTTHPLAIRDLERRLDLERTLFISASKSGSTLETRSHTDYFWKLAPRGRQWVAITDPGSALAGLGHDRSFAAIVPGEPTIGGRYSALSAFGILPAALIGVDIVGLLERASEMAEACRGDEGNPGLELGLSLGENWREGRDKVCLPDAGVFGLWVEQLIAESTGKQGKGLVPAPGLSAGKPDRQEQEVRLADPLELGQEFFRWEFATAVAGSMLGINPFDQPDVQAAKDKTNEVLAGGDVTLAPVGSIEELCAGAEPPAYLCIQAFVNPTAENEATIEALAARLAGTGCVVTHGFGPRYLHSTGQLHKGGPDTGRYLQVVEDYGAELEIPGQPFGFARLIRAQAAGDLESLRERGRRIARVHLEELETVKEV